VFIGWSEKNTRSHKVAVLLKSWLPKVIQKLHCFVSSHDIEAGATWIKELFARLDECDVGILCVTQRSISRPWMFFEAGALAKKLEESRVCPLLIDVQPSDVQFPLAAFQLKTTSKEDIRSLIDMINRTRGDEALTTDELSEVFEFRWPLFESELRKMVKQSDGETVQTKARPDRELLEELLTLTRGIASGGIKVVPEQEPPRNRERSGKSLSISGDCAEIVTHLLKTMQSSGRRFLKALVEDAYHYSRDGDFLIMSFTHDRKSFVETLSTPRNIEFLEKTIKEIAPLKLRIKVAES
jgi:TIR domain-containing protein